MPALASHQSSQSVNSVTSISAIARVDYILRFSQHVVVVVDELQQGYSEVGSQFLDALPDEHNAAFISISSKLNDIQVRCRIIEQLFGNLPFDPEVSLAKTIISLLDDKSISLSIVLDNCQHVSLQILHELCQLAEIAKKTNRKVNIVLLGSIAIGKLIALNSSLFKQKLSIISEQTGQLIPPNAELFKEPQSVMAYTPAKKMITLVTILFLISAVIIYQLYKRESLLLNDLSKSASVITQATNLKKQDTFIKLNKKQMLEDNVNLELASNIEIYKSIIAQKSKSSDVVEIAGSKDIFAAINISSSALEQIKNEESTIEVNKTASAVSNIDVKVVEQSQASVEIIATDELNERISEISPSYYDTFEHGFVIQFANLSINSNEEAVFNAFVNLYPNDIFNAYQRTINQQNYLVITSLIFNTKEAAKAAILTFPEELIKSGPWVKSLSLVKNEIQQYQGAIQ